MEWLKMAQWSPYAVGIGIGVLSWLAFLLSDKQIGCSAAFSRTSGMVERLFRGSRVTEKPYYKKFTPTVDWQWMLVIGILVGAFISAQLSGEFRATWIPQMWASSFGSGIAMRWIVALIGGVLIGLGARWAGGCTSGHGISGTLQLAVSSWVAVMGFFIGGIVTAVAIYRFF
jgi:uncharacterized membrane protein YedE/YeeE